MRGAPLLATIALVPLILTPHLLFYYDVTPKIAVLLVGVSLALVLSRVDLRSLWSHRASRWFVYLAAFQWIWCALATALSSNPALSLNGGTWRRSGLITQTGVLILALLGLAWLLENSSNIRLLLRVVSIAGVLISAYTIAQYFGIDPLLPATAYQSGEGPFTIVRPPGTLGHADYLAAWLLFAAFCSPLSTFPFALFAIVLSGTRSALLGLVAGAILFSLFRYRSSTTRQRLAAAASITLLGIFVVSPAGAKLRARVHWSLDDMRGGARLLLWRDALPMVALHPLTGSGPETFGIQFPLHQSLDLASTYPDFYHESPHNLLLDLAINRGIPAAVAFLVLCGLAFWSGIRSQSDLAPPLMAGLAALLVAHIFIVFTMPTELAFYLLSAMLISLNGTYEPRALTNRLQLAPVRYGLASLLFIFTVRSVAGDFLLARAQQRIAQEDVAGAASAYHASLRWQPDYTGADLSYSRQMRGLAARSTVFRIRLDALQQALESGVRATEHSDQRQNAWYNLAELFAARNDAAAMEHSLRNAIAWSPNWFKPHWILAQLLETEHRQPEALVEAQAALERDGGRDAEVFQTWTRIRGAHLQH